MGRRVGSGGTIDGDAESEAAAQPFPDAGH
jgi:hypothetical protein